MLTDRLRAFCLIGLLGCSSPPALADSQLQQLLLDQEYVAAWQRAQSLEAELAGDPAFDFLYAQAALAAGKADYAVFALERVLLQQPDHHRARAELARAYYHSGNWDAAERHFQRVLAINPPANVRANIQQFLDAIERQRSLLSSRWSAFVELRSGYDSNVNSATTETTVSTPAFGVIPLSASSTEQSDHFLDKNAGFIWQKPLAKTRGLFATLQYRDRENFDTQTSDLRSIGVSAGPMFAVAGGRLTVPLNAQTLYLANERYRNLLAVSANWLRPLTAEDDVTLFAQLGSIKYPGQSARDVDTALLGIGWDHRLAEPEVAFSLSAYLGDEDTQSSAAQQNGKDYYGVRLAADWAFRTDHSLYANLTGQWSQHDAQDAVFAVTRKEDFAQLVLGWAYEIAQPWTLSVELSAIENNSTIALYEYDRRQVLLGVKYRFE